MEALSPCSSATSSVMVSREGELEGLVGRIMGAGATSIHELKFLIPLAIDELQNLVNAKKFSPPPKR